MNRALTQSSIHLLFPLRNSHDVARRAAVRELLHLIIRHFSEAAR